MYSLQNLINKPYKYGFVTRIEVDAISKGLTETSIRLISLKKQEPDFILRFRLKAFQKWKKMSKPRWSFIRNQKSIFDYQRLKYYSAPKTSKNKDSKQLDAELIQTFEKLGVNLNNKEGGNPVAVDAIFDSVSVGTTFKDELAKLGIIFCPISDALKYYPELVQSFLGSVIPPGDNFFAALNSATFTDGSFCFIPRDCVCPFDLSTYFRVNDQESGQFERTLIVAEENSYVSYLEGCTAPQYATNQLHAAIVELIGLDFSEIKYSTVQNWYAGDENGVGGLYNFVTKRALCLGDHSKISWTQVETGSAITWKYPSCTLIGKNSIGEFYSVALTNNYQQADTGTKMLHIGENTRSRIISKGISTGQSKNIYRGFVYISPKAIGARNYSQCDSLLIGQSSSANTCPYIQIKNPTAKIEHEASTSKIGEEQIFYLLQRGISIEEAVTLIIGGFCNEVFSVLPLEFASEADRLLSLKLEGTIG